MPVSEAQFGALQRALAAILPFAGPADATLRHFFRTHPELGLRDRAFVAETLYAILRHRRFLDHVAPEASVRQLALAGLIRVVGYSMRELEPLLNEADFAWLRELKGRPAPASNLAVQADLPDWVVERLANQWPAQTILALGQSLQAPAPLDLRVNTLFTSREAVLAELARDGIAAHATPYSPVGVRLAEKPAINRHPLFLSGKVEVQDEASQLVCYLVAPHRHDWVVDFCAGAGGKSLMLGALMHSQGRLYAFDVSNTRLNNLRTRLKRSGLSNLHASHITSENDARISRLSGKMHRVLVDAPCSGLGTLRRNPDLKWRQSPEAVLELTAKQGAILGAASALVKAGGRLVYATCSFLPEENEQVVSRFLDQQPEFHVVAAGEILSAHKIPLQTGEYLRLYPQIHGTDGFFAAVLGKSG